MKKRFMVQPLCTGLICAGMLTACVSTGSGMTSQTGGSAHAGTEYIPVEDFFRNPSKSRFTVSPDGTHIAFMQAWKNRMNIFVQKRDSDTAVRVTAAENRDIADYFWANNSLLAFLQDTGGDENYQLFTVQKDGSNLKNVTPFKTFS